MVSPCQEQANSISHQPVGLGDKKLYFEYNKGRILGLDPPQIPISAHNAEVLPREEQAKKTKR